MALQGKRMCTIDGADYSANWVRMESLHPSGPGVVGSCNLYFEKVGGGLTIRNKQVVRLWQAWDSTGVGVAPKGRWLIGLIDGRATTAKAQIAQWKVAVTDCNILLKHLRIDIDDSRTVVIPGGSFGAQIQALTQAVQRQGHADVNIEIAADSNSVNDLVPTGMPAYTAHAKTYGQMLLEICTNARAINQALRPQFYIGVGATFGVGDVVGNPVLWVWDGAAVGASPAWVFSDTPSGGQRYRYGVPTRSLDSTKVSTRAQSWYGPAQLPATYANPVAAAAYPNQFINHGANPAGNSGYWQAIDPAKDSVSTTGPDAIAQLKIAVDQVAYPREVYEHGSDVPVLPGDVVTEIDSLEDGLGGSGVNYRVVQVGIDVTSDDDPFYVLTLGARRLELLESGEGILAAPAEGDHNLPLAPTGLTLQSQVWQSTRNQYLQTWVWVNSASRDVDRHVFQNLANIQEIMYLHLEGSYQRYASPGSAYDIVVQAIDTHQNWSPNSNEVVGSAPGAPALPPPTALAQASVYDPAINKTTLTFTWTPSADPSVLLQRVQATVVGGTTQETVVAAGATQAVFNVPPGSTIHQARVRAESQYAVSAWAPSTAGMADFVVASAGLLPAVPTFSVNSNVYLANVDKAQLQFIWSTPADPNGLGIAGYRLTINQGGIGQSIILPVQTSYLRLMLPALAYTASVAAVDSYGRAGISTAIGGTTAGRVHDFLYNPSFEWLEQVPNPTYPDGWTFTNNNGVVIWDGPPNGAAYGSRFLSFTWSAGATPPVALSDYFKYDPNSSYQFDAMLESSAADSLGIYFDLYLYDANFVVVGSANPYEVQLAPATTAWARTVGYNYLPIQAGLMGGAVYARIGLKPNGVGALKKSIDLVRFGEQVSTQQVADGAITAQKLASTLDYVGWTPVIKNAGFTIDSSATVYICTNAGIISATLPTAIGIAGRIYVIKRAGGGRVTVQCTGGQTIDGLATYPMVEQGQAVWVQSDGAGWRIIAQAGLALESDTTRWLGPELPLAMQSWVAPPPYAATNTDVLLMAASATWPLLLTRWECAFLPNSGNTGAVFWNLALRRYLTGGTTSTMATISSTGLANGSWTHMTPLTTFSNNPTLTTDIFMDIFATMTGTPGSFYTANALYGRSVYS